MKRINTYITEKLHISNKHKHTCQPKSKDELQEIIITRIKDDGPTCDLNDIDTSKITDMSNLFDAAINKIFKNFNGDVSMWDVSNVQYMYGMFWSCEKFNCDLSKWNVSNVEDTGYMFFGCKKFNCDLSKWNVSKVRNIECILYGCKNFNQDLNKWNVSKVEEMRWAFYKCPTQPEWYNKSK